MYFFDNLKDVKNVSNTQEAEREIKSDELLHDGIGLMTEFKVRKEKSLLISASELFFEAIKYKRTNPSPYVWLAYIFYLLDKRENAVKYIKLATMFKATGEMLEELKKKLNLSVVKQAPSTVQPGIHKPGGFIKQLKLLKSSF